MQRRQSPKTLQPAGLGGEALTGLVPEGGGTGCRAKLPQETLSWKMCGPITLLGRGGGGGRKVLLKMAGELHKELQLSPQTAAWPWCQAP